MPLSLIAARIGCSIRTVDRVLDRALAKLRNNPGEFELILASVHAAADETVYGPACGSVECNREFIKLYAGVQ